MNELFLSTQRFFVEVDEARSYEGHTPSKNYSLDNLDKFLVDRSSFTASSNLGLYSALTEQFPDLNADIKARAFVIEQTANGLFTFHQENTEYQTFVYYWAILWCRCSLQVSEQDLEQTSKIFRSLFDYIYSALQLADEFSGKLLSQFITNLTKIISHSAKQAAHPCLKQIQRQFTKSRAMFEKLKAENLQQAIARVAYLSNEREARTKTSKAISQAIGDGHYPIVLLKFIENYIAPELEQCFIQVGAKSKKWKTLLRGIRIMIWAFRANSDDSYKNEFKRKVMPALRDVCNSCLDGDVDQEQFINDFILVEELLKRKSLGFYDKLNTVFNAPQVDSGSLFKRRIEVNCSLELNETQPTKGVLFYQNQLINGYLYSLQNDDGYLVFLNPSFELAVAIDRNQKNIFDSEAHLFPQSIKVDWRYINVFIESELAQIRCQFENDYRDTLEAIRTKHDIEANERFENERVSLELKLEALKDEYSRKQHQLTEIKSEQAIKQQSSNVSSNIIDKIKDGALGQLVEGESKVPVTLVAITQSTGRYIFNKSNGQGQLRLKRSELAAMLLSNQLTITQYESPDHYENSLQSIIKMRRESLSGSSSIAV